MFKKFMIFVILLCLFFFYLSDILDYGVQKGLTDTPKRPGLTLNCAWWMKTTGDYGKAAAAYKEAIKTWPDHPDAPRMYINLGICYENLGKKGDAKSGEYYKNARKAYLDFMQKYPDHGSFDVIKKRNEDLHIFIQP